MSSFREMVVKQQITRAKKEHEELLKRGDQALTLSNEIELSFAEDGALTREDLSKLQELEKLVSRIRKDLGGDAADGKFEFDDNNPEKAAQDRSAVITFLIDSTRSLVDELKKMSRFSISVIAVQTSNNIIRFARLLRLKS